MQALLKCLLAPKTNAIVTEPLYGLLTLSGTDSKFTLARSEVSQPRALAWFYSVVLLYVFWAH